MTVAVLPPLAEPATLSGFDGVFVDSRLALDAVRRLGLRPGASLRTISPALALDPGSGVELADEHLPRNYRAAFAETIAQVSLDAYRRCLRHPEYGPLAIVIAQRIVLQSGLVWSAMMVRPDDSTRRLAAVRPAQAGQPHGVVVTSGWERLLMATGNLRVIEVDAPHLRDAPKPLPSVSFFDRQRLGRMEKVGYQLVSKAWRASSFRSPRGTFLILRENYLVREAALALALRGFGLKWLALPKGTAHDVVKADHLTAFLAPALEPLRSLIAPFVWSALLGQLAEDFGRAANRYHAALPHWRTSLAEAKRHGVRGILTNVMIAPDTAALHDACRAQGVPLFAFQHGNSREISRNMAHVEAIFEGNVADHYLTFSPEAAEVSMRNPFNRCIATPVGLPAGYSRAASYRRSRSRSPTVLFVSSTLYAGHFAPMVAGRGASDIDMARNDVELVTRVLSAIPYRVVFKPYPAIRYPDPDPVLEAAARAPNIEVFAGFEDVSLLLPDADLIVSARATSTIAWGATGTKPFVLIDHPEDSSIRAEALPHFQRSFFVFNRADPDFCERLREFLSQPLSVIEAEWKRREPARRLTLLRFFGIYDGHAGRRAARIIQAVSAKI